MWLWLRGRAGVLILQLFDEGMINKCSSAAQILLM